jgi:hypothetical protein
LTGGGGILGSINANGTNINSFFGVTPVNIGGSVRFTATNENILGFYDLFNLNIGGSVTIMSGNDTDAVNLSSTIIGTDFYANLGNNANGLTMDALSIVGRNFTLVTGSFTDTVGLNGIIGGNASFNLGVGENSLDFAVGAVVGGNFSYVGGLGTDDLGSVTGFAGEIGGSAYFNMGGGANTLNFIGTVGGSSLTYAGGIGVDDVTFDGDAGLAFVNINLSSGNDSLELGASALLSRLYADFGAGTDTFTNLLGLFTFPVTLRNLP